MVLLCSALLFLLNPTNLLIYTGWRDILILFIIEFATIQFISVNSACYIPGWFSKKDGRSLRAAILRSWFTRISWYQNFFTSIMQHLQQLRSIWWYSFLNYYFLTWRDEKCFYNYERTKVIIKRIREFNYSHSMRIVRILIWFYDISRLYNGT